MGFAEKVFMISQIVIVKKYSNQTTSTLALLIFASSQIQQFNWYNDCR
jgi:hypothetical protein